MTRHASIAKAALVAVLAPLAAHAQDDTLVVARAMDINSLDPSRAFCDTCQIYVSATYDTLVTLAPDNESIVPSLATKWESNEEMTGFTFHLAPDAVFSDGSPVEAKDVVWSLQRVLNLKASPSFLMEGMTSAEAVDAHTVKVTLDGPNSEFINKLSAAYIAIMNSDVASEHGAAAGEDAAAADQAESWFMENSAGSGPYMLANYAPNDEIRLEANPNYWKEKPAFSTVVIDEIQDAVSQAQALESGAADIAMQIDPDTASNIGSDEVVTEQIPSFNFVYVAFVPGGNDVLTPEVREALTYAIDYQGAIEFTVGGAGEPNPAPIPNGFPGAKGLEPRQENVDKAKEMLEAAGHGDGFSLVMGYPNLNVYGVDLNFLAQKVQQDLARVNVTLELKPLTFPVWVDELNGGKLGMTAVYYAPDYFGTAQYPGYFAMMPGTSWFKRAGGSTPELVQNPKEAELYKQALGQSGEENIASWHELAKEMMADNIIIPLVSPNLVIAHRKDIEGVRYSACCNLPLAEIKPAE